MTLEWARKHALDMNLIMMTRWSIGYIFSPASISSHQKVLILRFPSLFSLISHAYPFMRFSVSKKKEKQHPLDTRKNKITCSDIGGLGVCCLWRCANIILGGRMVTLKLSLLMPRGTDAMSAVLFHMFKPVNSSFDTTYFTFDIIQHELFFQQGCCFIATQTPSAPIRTGYMTQKWKESTFQSPEEKRGSAHKQKNEN